MSLKVRILDSPAALRGVSHAWDELWWRAEASLPTLRAETAAQWSEHFASGRLAAVCIEHEGSFVAALPMVPLPFKRAIPAMGPASGVWSRCGDLLLDPQADREAVCGLLLRALRTLRPLLMWCDAMAYEQQAWASLRQAAVEQGWAHACIPQAAVGQLELRREWGEYFSSRSKSHRRALRRAEKCAEQMGGVEVAWHEAPSPESAAELVRMGFEVEHRGWKGRCGGSVLSVPGLLSFFQRQARQLAEWGQLRLVFLLHRGQPIAFEYAPCAKGVYHAVKVGYDEAWHALSPGQLLRYLAYPALFADPAMYRIDFSGPLTQATARWSTHAEPRGSLLFAHSLAGRAILAAYRALRPVLRRLRSAPPPETFELPRSLNLPRSAHRN